MLRGEQRPGSILYRDGIAKISQFSWLPQGDPERTRRALNMVEQMDAEGFGDCSNHGECEAVCPKEISIDFIALMNKDYLKSKFKNRELLSR